jgi:signal transduction histidine kinase
MSRLTGWLRSPPSLPLLLGLAVALPAATLILLGVRLLEQDRALAGQRRAELAQGAADRAVRALEQEVAAAVRRLAEPAWIVIAPPAAGTVHLLITSADLRVDPPSGTAWHPAAPPLPEPPAAPFAEAEAAEFRFADFDKALVLNTRLALSPDAATRAGALLRQARVLRKMGRTAEAAATLERLGAMSGVAINGVPVDLVARQARCVIAQGQSDAGLLRDRALELQRDLNAGRWMLDRASYEFVAGRVAGWLGAESRSDSDREALAAAADWLAQGSAGLPPAGSHVVASSGVAAVVIWAASPGRVAAIAVLPSFVDRTWKPVADRAASPATLVLAAAGNARPEPSSSGTNEAAVTRTAADTGLPWTVVARVPDGDDIDGLAARERTLLAGLAAVLLLAAAGTFLVVRAREQEISLSRLQTDFVSAVSHEFRTPLTALGQFNELLAEDDTLPRETRRSYHLAQARATERLRRLVESLLDFGRMEAGRRPYVFQRVDAGALVRDTVDEFRAGLEGRGFDVRCEVEDGDHPIHADAEALGRALWNLLDNAVKYSGERRELRVTVGGAASADAFPGPAVAIAVRDFGIGIPRRDQARIFQRFVRGADAMAAPIQGTGIGLAMVRHIVSAHRGRILIESEPGRGSTFTIVIGRSPSCAS